jgi:tRNA1Val (adenine37-N6)-methyltransferase
MSVFHFKRFDVVNERSAMKVNTDGVLLGAVMTIMPTDRRLLDIGTGTGTIALMAAQRLSDLNNSVPLHIDAIDIDEPSASEAAANFSGSSWRDILEAHHVSLDSFADSAQVYDLIFSNPPYFEDSLTAPDQRKSTARHTSDGLSYRDIFEFASTRLSESGRVALVLPAEQEAALCRYARMCGLHLMRITRIRTVPRKAPSRIVAEFSRHRTEHPEDVVMTIQNEGQYTEEYLSLMKEFYLFA